MPPEMPWAHFHESLIPELEDGPDEFVERLRDTVRSGEEVTLSTIGLGSGPPGIRFSNAPRARKCLGQFVPDHLLEGGPANKAPGYVNKYTQEERDEFMEKRRRRSIADEIHQDVLEKERLRMKQRTKEKIDRLKAVEDYISMVMSG